MRNGSWLENMFSKNLFFETNGSKADRSVFTKANQSQWELAISSSYRKPVFPMCYLLWIILKNGQTCFENLAVWITQHFESMSGHFFNIMHEMLNKKNFSEKFREIQKNTCNKVLFSSRNPTKNGTPLQVVSYEFREVFQNSFSVKHLWTVASAINLSKLSRCLDK